MKIFERNTHTNYTALMQAIACFPVFRINNKAISCINFIFLINQQFK